MTVIVGIKCKDGIVIGADSSATFGNGQLRTIEQKTKKIEILHNKIIVAGTGQIGLGQRFCNTVDLGYSNGSFKNKNGIQMATHMTELTVKDFASSGANQGQFGALVAFPAGHDIHLCEFSVSDFQPELKTTGIWYASMGSGQLIADPFLGLMRSVFWKDGMPSLQDGIFIATWAIQHAIEVNAGGVNGPIQMAELTNKNGNVSARMLTEDELTEHQENVSGALDHLRSYRDKLAGKLADTIPDIPTV
jgi:20S proteasome alpha/beta subunit